MSQSVPAVDPALLLFTVEGADLILKRNWSGFHRINPDRARQFAYAVLCQNANCGGDKVDWDFATGDQAHGSGFMVAKITAVVPSPQVPDRYNIEFSEFAPINIPGLWKGWRYAVNYQNTLQSLGLDPATLTFQPMPPPTVEDTPPTAAAGVTAEVDAPALQDDAMADIERFAAKRLNVDVADLEIAVSLRRRRLPVPA